VICSVMAGSSVCGAWPRTLWVVLSV